ncbi:MAG TPA: S9 family peptidase [Gemmatimonadales bacterium]|jgi:dipeptidyl aminopeptidase/acylaminoacyl peptidase|nr:S9 family peptidase [Gemmatimonadales bacterium]
MHSRLVVFVVRVLAIAVTAIPTTANRSPLSAQARAFTPADWYLVTTLSTPAVSPDGKQVAFTVTTVRAAENKRHSEVWLVPTAGGDAMRLTSPGVESSNPRWSPDGKLLLFASQRPGGKGRTWALRMDRPGGEAFEVDSIPAGSTPRDGRFVVWAESDTAAARDTTKKDAYDKMQPMARPPFGAITWPVDPARFDGRHLTEMQYKGNGIGFIPAPREARVERPAQIWMRPLDGGPKKQLTTTAYSHRGVAASPDGQWIAFTADARLRPDSVVRAERDSLGRLPYDAKRDEAPRNDTDIFVIPAAAGGATPRRVTTANGNESQPLWSPDSRRLAFLSNVTRTAPERIYVVDAAGGGGTPQNLLGEWPYEPDAVEWLPDGRITFAAAVGGRTALFLLDPAAKQPLPVEVLGGRRRLAGFDWDHEGKVVAYVSTSMTRPTELFTASADGQGERQLTHFNDKLNTEIAWSDAERFSYKSVGNLEIEGWLMKPYGYVAGKKYPLALYIHGGPHSAYGENWFDEFQNLAGAGMWVLFTNPRGSTGYGAQFTYATRGRWGAEDYQDLMKAVDIVAKRPDVDSTRMGVTGGSYGGFMTAWVTTRTTRFRAAQTDRMISEWTFWYGASDAQGLTEFEFYGKPWESQPIYDSLSPIRRVNRVKTATLMVQSEEDYRTPMGNAELWYMALKKQGVPVELVRYPRSNHDLSRTGEPWLLVDRLGRLRQWFGYWLKGETGARTAVSGEREQHQQ